MNIPPEMIESALTRPKIWSILITFQTQSSTLTQVNSLGIENDMTRHYQQILHFGGFFSIKIVQLRFYGKAGQLHKTAGSRQMV